MVPFEDQNMDQIQYLVQQSTLGYHFLFDKADIVKALKKTEKEGPDFFTFENRNKVQNLLLKIIERKTMREKKSYIESLDDNDHELLIQAYFHLVDNTILASSKLRH